MTFRCNRLGNLFVKLAVARIIFVYIFFSISVVIWILADGLDAFRQWWVFVIVSLIPATVSIIWLLQYPKEFIVESNRFIWVESLPTQRTSKESCRAVVTVGDLHAIEFIQSPIERLLNIGQIRFMGDIRSLEAPKTVERPDMPFWYGGIREFEQFKAYLQQNLPKSAFLQ